MCKDLSCPSNGQMGGVLEIVLGHAVLHLAHVFSGRPIQTFNNSAGQLSCLRPPTTGVLQMTITPSNLFLGLFVQQSWPFCLL
jgi:hypothetical protein